MLTPELAILWSIVLCMGGAVAALVTARNRTVAGWVTFGVTVATAVLVGWAVARVLSVGPSAHPATFWEVPALGFALRIHVDGLTAVFLTLSAVIAVPASLYSVEYMRHYAKYGVGRYYPYFLLFLAAMYGLVSTTDMMWFFFMFWQMMTLPGYALIRFEHRRRESVRAATKYLVMMQIACAATMIGAELLTSGAGTGGKYDFESVSAGLPGLLAARPALSAVAFGLFLVGFGIKMGMWPFGQVWLPDAHPAAPSPVSAMLSGVMIKTGVYGLLRYFLWLVPHDGWAHFPLANWGLVVAGLGTLTLFTGTMQALRQEHSKRLLAFHSIGQIGYVLLGAGACMALLPATDPAVAGLAGVALFGALFHVLNHGMFKGLLFLNAGSMLCATGTQDLNRMGGLMRYMPLTAVTALVASLSISGVPPLNGFASKWAIYVASVQGAPGARYLPVCALVAILTSALTLASFVKFFGTSFLSRASDEVVARSRREGGMEVGWRMQAPQVFLATACVALGVVPALGAWFVQAALGASRQGYGVALAGLAPVHADAVRGMAAGAYVAVLAPLAVVGVLAAVFVGARALARSAGSQRRAAEPWLCGYAREAQSNRYVAHNFYGEIKRHFRWVGGAPRPAAGNGSAAAAAAKRTTPRQDGASW